MIDLAAFLDLCSRYAAATGLAEATVSTRVLKAGSRITDLREGKSDIGVRRLARAVEWFSNNWPDGLEWPAGVERPSPVVGLSPAGSAP